MASIIGVKNVWGSWGITKSSEFLGEVVVMRFFPRPSPSRSNPLLRSFHPSRCHVCTPSRMAPGPAATLDYSMLLLFTLGSSNLETSLWGGPFHQPTNQTVHSEYFRMKSLHFVIAYISDAIFVCTIFSTEELKHKLSYTPARRTVRV